jgi:hypothetical protein
VLKAPNVRSALEKEKQLTILLAAAPLAIEFWRNIGGGAIHTALDAELWNPELPNSTLAPMASTFLLLCCWKLWKHRNEFVFRHE